MPFLRNKNFSFLISGKNLLRIELILGFIVVNFFGIFYSKIGLLGYTKEAAFYLSLFYLFFFFSSFFIKWVWQRQKLIVILLYVLSLFMVLKINYENNFDQEYFLSFLFIYTFFAFIQDRIDLYVKANILIVLGFLTALFSGEVETKPITLILSFCLIFLIGLVVTFSRSLTRKKLLTRKNLLNYIFNNASEGLILIERKNGTVVDANNESVKIFGRNKRENLIGESIENLMVVGEKIFEGRLKKKQRQSIQLKDQRILHYGINAFDYYKESFWLIDIKAYKNREELNISMEFDRLKNTSEENYKYLFEESSSLICVISKNGKIIDVNKSLADQLNYEKKEIIGKSFDFLDSKSNLERDKFNRAAWKGEKVEFEKSIKSKEGEILEIETILRKGKYFGEEVLISNSRDISRRKELERKVQFNLRRYTMLFELSPISIAISDLKGNIIDSNSSFRNIIGYTEEELRKMNVEDISHQEDMEINLDLRQQLLDGEILQMEMQKRFITKNGKIIYTLLKTTVLKDEQEEPQGLLAQIIDITDIKEAQKQLEISEKSYRDLFNNSYDLLYILNNENVFIDVNQSVIDKYGYSEKEILGKKPILFAAPDLNDLEEVSRKIEAAWKGEEQNLLWWSKKKNGDIFPKDLNLKKGVYKGEDVLMATGRDISESYNFERKLKEKERRYRNLFERNLAGVYRTSQDGKLLECNNSFAKILGFGSKDEIKSEANANHFYVDRKERENLLNKLKVERNIRGEKIHLKRKDGEEITVLLNVSAIYDENENFNYLEGSLIDITRLDRAQELLSESQDKYRKLIDNSSFGIMIFYRGKIIFSNDKAAQILKYKSKEELLNKEKVDFLKKSDEPFFIKRLEKIKEGEEVPFRELKMINADGDLIDVETKPTQVNFENKDCILISFIDVTDRKKIERAREKAKSAETFNKILQAELKEKEKAQKRLVDAQSYAEGIIESSIDMIFTTDINGRINKLNSAAKRELKVNKDYLNKPLEIFFKDNQEGIRVLQALEKSNSFSGEVELKRSDGTFFPAYLSMSYLYNSDEVVLGIMGVTRDISEIKQKELEIKEQAAKLNTIIESSSHFFFTVDRKYNITSYNHVFENDVINNIGKKLKKRTHFYQIFPEYLKEDEESLKKFWDNKFKKAFKGESTSFELKRKNTKGKIYFREVYLNPIYSDEGLVEEISGIGHDITDKKLSEENLKSSLKEKEVLLKEVHHRVKNNMQVISSILSLQSAYVTDETILNILRESQNRIKSMAFIHERLYRTKDFSQIKFSDYVKNLAQNLVDTYELSNADVKLECKLEEVFLNLDNAIPCGLIINELISNSLKYAFVSGDEGKIKIVLQKEGNEIELKISDNGVGVPDNIDFRNTDSLGLQLVNTLVEQLEGEVDLDRKNGTSYTIKFKVKEAKDV